MGLQLVAGGRLAGFVHQPEQQVLGADVLVLHRLGLRLRGVEHHAKAGGQVWFSAAVRLGLCGQVGAQRTCHHRRLDAEAAQHAGHHAVLLFGKRHQQVLGLDLRVVQLRRQLRRRQHGLLGFLGELVQIHGGLAYSLVAFRCSLFATRRAS